MDKRKVYLLTGGDGSDGNEWYLDGVFATKEAAERERLKQPEWKQGNMQVEEWPVID